MQNETIEEPTFEIVVSKSTKEITDPAERESIQTGYAPLWDNIQKTMKAAVAVVSGAKEARRARLDLVPVRTEIERTRKSLKEASLKKGKAIDGLAAALTYDITQEESRLEAIETAAATAEAARIEGVRTFRMAALEGVITADTLIPPNLAILTDEQFDRYLDEQKTLAQIRADRAARELADKLELERLAEEKRLADEAERVRIAEENARLKAEAEEREAAAKAEREAAAAELAYIEAQAKAEKERAEAAAQKAADEAAAKLRAEQEKAAAATAKLKKEADAREAKLRAEQKAKDDAAAAALKAEQDRAEAIRLTNEKAAKDAKDKADKEAADAKALADATLAKAQAATLKAQKEAKALADAETAKELAKQQEAERALAAPDKEKLAALAAAIRALVVPTLTSRKAATLMPHITEAIEALAVRVETAAANI